MKRILLLSIYLSFSLAVCAQTATITGSVKDPEGSALDLVNVRLIDTPFGSSTNRQGQFTIKNIPPGTYVLQASLVGFETAQREILVQAGETLELDIKLSEDVASLSEVLIRDKREKYKADVASSALKTPTPIMKTPQTISVITEQVIDDQLIFTLADILENVSGVGTEDGFGQTLDGFALRGFFSRDVYIDGIPETEANFIKMDIATIERVEVLKGPASAVFGRSQPGGLVNIIQKKPLLNPAYSFELTGGGNDEFYRASVDLTGPLDKKGNIRYRVIGAAEYTDSFRDFIDGDTQVFAPSLEVDFTDRFKFSFDFLYQRDATPIDRGIPAEDGRPSPRVDESFSMSGPQQDREAEEWRGRTTLQFDVNENLSLFQHTRIASAENDFVNVQPRGIVGDEITRSANKNNNEADTYLYQLEALYKKTLFGIDHTLFAGAEYRRDEFEFSFRLSDAPNLNINNPDYSFVPDFPATRTGGGQFPTETYAVYLQDQFDLTEKFTFVLGGRIDWAEVESEFEFQGNVTTQSTSSSEFTPRVGIVYRPVEMLSLFGNYTESFLPQNGRDAQGRPFDPEEGQQYEFGAKIQALDGRLQATLAYFDIEKSNIAVADPTSQTGASILTGEQQSEGFEIDVIGTLIPGWQIIANYSYTDAEISEDTNPEFLGRQLPNIAENRGRLWSTYQVQQGTLKNLRIGAGVTIVDDRYGDLQNTVNLPDYTVVGATLSYSPPAIPWAEATLRFENLFDEEYYTSGVSFGAKNIQVGAPRTVVSTLRFNF